MRLSSRVAFALPLAIMLTLPALAAAPTDEPEGHWDYLGGDGRIWVPAHPPAVTALPDATLGDYHNVTEAVDALTALASARPDILTLQTMGSSVQGRPILLATLTAPGDASDRTRVLFDGAHHGDEVIGSEILVRFVQRVVAEYDTNASMRAMLEDVVVDIVPMVNPDGIAHVPQCSFYADCRKNARGVDLNRNYEAHWGEPGSSGNPSDATYRGPSAASEPETQVITGLLDTNPYAIYASLHSGAEMILWPWGWTTTPPPEAAMYNQLGDELSAITGAPHGQVSRILYGVSGDSMDQAYGEADAWRSVAISPETYEGSGSAFNWWLLFNPHEANSFIQPVVNRWDKFLWHLVAVAPQYAPATLSAPESLTLGPDAGELSFVVTAPARRPILGGTVAFASASDAATVLGDNPVLVPQTGGAHSGTFSLLPTRGGAFDATVTLDAGPGGSITRAVSLDLVQVAADLALADDVMEAPDTNVATVTIDAGPFSHVAGNVALTIAGVARGTLPFTATPGAPAVLTVSFDARDIPGGTHDAVALATFNATGEGGVVKPGQIIARASLTVLRPQLDLDKRFVPESAVGEALLVTSVFRNTGTMTASGVVAREHVPPGYVFWTRDGPVPVPTDPLGRPVPTSIEPTPDGGIDLVFDLGNVQPGKTAFAQYRILPLVPGEHALPSAYAYDGAFASETIRFEESVAPMHTVVGP